MGRNSTQTVSQAPDWTHDAGTVRLQCYDNGRMMKIKHTYNMNNLIARFMISYTIINQKEYTLDTIKCLKINLKKC